jgi:hypothetical protein
MPTPETTLAQLAVEYWKLLRIVERAIEAAPAGAKERLASQARYSAARLDTLLTDQNMSVQGFDGMDFEVNLPASPINGDDFPKAAGVVVERTLEPAVISNMGVVIMGKVFLAKKD